MILGTISTEDTAPHRVMEAAAGSVTQPSGSGRPDPERTRAESSSRSGGQRGVGVKSDGDQEGTARRDGGRHEGERNMEGANEGESEVHGHMRRRMKGSMRAGRGRDGGGGGRG